MNLELPKGILAGLIGPSGGGKSVLMKILGGIINPTQGQVDAPGDAGLMFQEGALFDSLTVFDNVAFPLVQGQVPAVLLPKGRREEVTEKVHTMLKRVGLAWAFYKFPAELSGGMRRRVSLARALVGHPEVVLLDDPTSGLDPVASKVIMNLVQELHREYHPTMLIISHDLRRLLPPLQRVYALFEGSIRFEGTVDGLLQCASFGISDFVQCRYDHLRCDESLRDAPSEKGCIAQP